MRYVDSKCIKEVNEKAYRFYMSDSIFYYGQDMRLGVRFKDIIEGKKIDARTGDEIALDVITRLGLKME